MYKACTVLNFSYQYFIIAIFELFNCGISTIKSGKDFSLNILVQKDNKNVYETVITKGTV